MINVTFRTVVIIKLWIFLVCNFHWFEELCWCMSFITNFRKQIILFLSGTVRAGLSAWVHFIDFTDSSWTEADWLWSSFKTWGLRAQIFDGRTSIDWMSGTGRETWMLREYKLQNYSYPWNISAFVPLQPQTLMCSIEILWYRPIQKSQANVWVAWDHLHTLWSLYSTIIATSLWGHISTISEHLLTESLLQNNSNSVTMDWYKILNCSDCIFWVVVNFHHSLTPFPAMSNFSFSFIFCFFILRQLPCPCWRKLWWCCHHNFI